MIAALKRLAIRLVIGLILAIIVVQGLVYWLTTGDGRTWENAPDLMSFLTNYNPWILGGIALLYIWKGGPRKKDN